jgi:hypothetical protein
MLWNPYKGREFYTYIHAPASYATKSRLVDVLGHSKYPRVGRIIHDPSVCAMDGRVEL